MAMAVVLVFSFAYIQQPPPTITTTPTSTTTTITTTTGDAESTRCNTAGHSLAAAGLLVFSVVLATNAEMRARKSALTYETAWASASRRSCRSSPSLHCASKLSFVCRTASLPFAAMSWAMLSASASTPAAGTLLKQRPSSFASGPCTCLWWDA